MTAIFLIDVVGDGQTPETAFRPDVPAGTDYRCLMIHEAKRKALIVSASDTLSGATRLVQAADMDALRAKAKSTSPTAAQRTTVNSWLTANTYKTLPAGVTWAQAIHHIARQVNPAADLERTA